MLSNLHRYKKDLDSLIVRGKELTLAMQAECFPKEFDEALTQQYGREAKEIRKTIPSFKKEYQPWYSEAKALVKQLLPDRLLDFVGHYERPKTRKDITYENYRIQDYLQGLNVTSGWEKRKIVGPDAAISHFEQQLAIVGSAKGRFESSLFDIRQLVQADLFDSDLDAAAALAKHRFQRAAGAVAGVVLEKHLGQVCENHSVKLTKNNLSISDLNNALKDANVIDVPEWRFVQHLGDIRNLCDHNKKAEPTAEQVSDLVSGVRKIVKTLF
jgi:hypothetical protein